MNWKCQFESIGVETPDRILTTQELVEKLKIPCIKKLGLLTGISERRVCSSGEDSFSLASAAAKNCLSYSKYRADEIDMIINCSITKYKNGLSHQYEPTFSAQIKHLIGASKATTFDISNACAGMMTGVYLAEGFIRQGMIKTCMIISGEYISNICDHAVNNIKTSLSPEIASLTVGDGGAAVIIERTDDNKNALSISGFTTLSKYSNLCSGRQNRNQQGGRMKTKAKKIHDAAISESYPIVKKALEQSNLTFNQINWLIPHQTSKSSIISGTNHYLDYFKQQPDRVLINLKETGNTASTSHFLALYRYLGEKQINENENIMLLCFASGLIIGVIIFKMNEMVHRYGNKN